MAIKITFLAENIKSATEVTTFALHNDCALMEYMETNSPLATKKPTVKKAKKKYKKRTTHGAKYELTGKDGGNLRGNRAEALEYIEQYVKHKLPMTYSELGRELEHVFDVKSAGQTAVKGLIAQDFLIASGQDIPVVRNAATIQEAA